MLNLAKGSEQNTSKEGAQLASPYLHVELGQGLCLFKTCASMTWVLLTFLEGQVGATSTPGAEGRVGVQPSPYLHVELGQGF